jgi:hypothetical protein
LQYYQELLTRSISHPSEHAGITCATEAAQLIQPDNCTKPIREAYFACLEDTIRCCKAAADKYRPAGSAAPPHSPTASTSSNRKGRRTSAAAVPGRPSFSEDSDDDYDNGDRGGGEPRLVGLGSSNRGHPGAGSSSSSSVLRLVPNDDVKLLLIGSNLSFLRSGLVGSLTQRFLLVLTGGGGVCGRWAAQVPCLPVDSLGL